MEVKVDVVVSLNKSGELSIAELGEPETLVVDSESIPGWTVDDSKRAERCIYCQSTDDLSDEHVVPFALGGQTLIWKGSCEDCRDKTQTFENAALNGEMQGARYVQQLPSRSRHVKAKKTVELEVVRDGDTTLETFNAADIPTILTLPTFGIPRYFDPLQADGKMRLEGTVGVCFGKDPNEFLREIQATTVRFPPGNSSPVQFARMVAKIAYGAAWLHGQLERVTDPQRLPKTLLDDPDQLGRLVGTLPQPYKIHAGVGHRFSFHTNSQGLLYCELQLFASAGAPTYIVILGKLQDSPKRG
jgi:hypothetical protein